MTSQEVDRLMIIKKVEQRQISQVEAAKQIGISDRQMRRLWSAYLKKGAEGLISKKRGHPSNRRISAQLLQKAGHLIREHYSDFGPTLAAEKLEERHQIKLSKETVRQLMISQGLWRASKARKLCVHQHRTRRAQEGELVQIDGSPHDWFEGRAEKCTLLVAVDDATSKLKALRFMPAETTEGYYELIKGYILEHGRPLNFYSDRHSIFRVNQREKANGARRTQLGRALKELDIRLICANSPQAKGRVERANGVLQDRLIKEMRLREISNIDDANAYTKEFITIYNQKFSVEAKDANDCHRPAYPKQELDDILANHDTRVLSKNLTFQYRNTLYQICTKKDARRLRYAQVKVIENQTNGIKVKHQEQELIYSTHIENPKESQGCVTNGKDLDQFMKKSKPSRSHPWRR